MKTKSESMRKRRGQQRGEDKERKQTAIRTDRRVKGRKKAKSSVRIYFLSLGL